MEIRQNGCVLLFDDEDMPNLIMWGYGTSYSKARDEYRVVGTRGVFRQKQISRLLLGAKSGILVDHHNGNTLDNRKQNLRLATHRQNAQNKVGHLSKELPKGITVRNGKYRVTITLNYSNLELGTFLDLDEAIKVREAAENKYFKEFSVHTRPQDADVSASVV